MVQMIDTMIKKFRINVNYILKNSDNTIDDIKNEAYIVLHEFIDTIQENEKVFINELRNRCLKFNKYNRKLVTKEDWERFNGYEENLQLEYDNGMEINEGTLLGLQVIK